MPKHIARSIAMIILSLVAWIMPAAAQSQAEPCYAEVFTTLRDNRTLYRLYQDSVNDRMPEEEWLDLLQRRAGVYRQLYAENNRAIASLDAYFSQPFEKISASAYDSLLHWTRDMYDEAYDDVFLLEHLTEMLLPHYEALSDTTNLLLLNHYMGYCCSEIALAYEPEAASRGVMYYKRNLAYGRHFASLDPQNALVIPAEYFNLCHNMVALEAVSPSESLLLMEEYERFLHDNRSHIPEDYMPRFEYYLDSLRSSSFRIISDVFRTRPTVDSLALVRMLELSTFCNRSLSSLSSSEDSIYHYVSMAMLHWVPAEPAFRRCDRILLGMMVGLNHQPMVSEYEVYTVSNCLISTLSLMEWSHPSEQYMMHRVSEYVSHLIRLVQHTTIVQDYTLFDYILSKLACERLILSHLPTSQKEAFMSQLAVKLQLGTVVHVGVVEQLCHSLMDRLIDTHPSLFVGVMGFVSEAEVQAHRDELLQYMSMAALFHDLGKNRMAEIVSNDYRRLTDHEFAIIRRHPELALEYLDMDPLFDKYRDVALGHHKWYNGQGGYPATFDNVASPWRPVIDLLTICDCIDAATDDINRNYRLPKTLDEVIKEFQRDAGVRYNPTIVDVLSTDTELVSALDFIIKHKRLEQARYVRNHYMH